VADVVKVGLLTIAVLLLAFSLVGHHIEGHRTHLHPAAAAATVAHTTDHSPDDTAQVAAAVMSCLGLLVTAVALLPPATRRTITPALIRAPGTSPPPRGRATSRLRTPIVESVVLVV
jgi:hypothetical protein